MHPSIRTDSQASPLHKVFRFHKGGFYEPR